MRDLEGKVAVVTGGASGVGRAMGERFAHEGMHVVLADVEQPVLDATVDELKAGGVEVTGIATDVSDLASVPVSRGAIQGRKAPRRPVPRLPSCPARSSPCGIHCG